MAGANAVECKRAPVRATTATRKYCETRFGLAGAGFLRAWEARNGFGRWQACRCSQTSADALHGPDAS